LVHRIFTENDVLVLEKLNVSGMLRNHVLAKSISDASWSRFAHKAIFKAESLGIHTPYSSTPGAPLSSATTVWDGSPRS
jgi:transposase